MYIYAPNETTETYPYSIGQLRKDNPQVSFPQNPSNTLLAEWNVYPVAPTEHPNYDAETQRVSEGKPRLINDTWTQTWVITNKSAEELNAELLNWRKKVKVSPLQFRRALRQSGLSTQVASYIATQDPDTQDAWEYAVEIRRADALISLAGQAMNKTPAEIDDLFRLAQTL